jgi:UDP-N-acetylmuramoyl-L-alanyl-D-glutamate--2,6-diaminopimelate ligase
MSVRPRPIAEVLAAVRGGPSLAVVGDSNAVVSEITLDSREVVDGAVFCCVPGDHRDGHDFAVDAVRAGAAALMVERSLPLDIPQIVVADTRAAVGWVAASLFGHPADDLTTVGITGTNGKTTTAHLVGHVLRTAGRSTEVFGTLSGRFTTPEAPSLQRELAACRDRGVDAVVMEVSSHALALHRVAGCHFDVGVFTNLGRDHLDFHGTVERYFAAKAMLFDPRLCDVGVVNADDLHGRLLLDTSPIPLEAYSIDDVRDVEIGPVAHGYTWRGTRIEVGIGGAFNAMNSLAAASTCRALGLDEATIAAALNTASPVPGRFEPIDEGQSFAVVVDYAHTPDGLESLLTAARATDGGSRLIVVFGCGGDRDREKRPLMGNVAATLADQVVITSDNPRSENPLAIINATLDGVPDDYRGNVVIEPDRRNAIAVALRMARPGDVVVIAGKGHETTQTIGSTVVDFDDRVVARQLLGEIGGTAR